MATQIKKHELQLPVYVLLMKFYHTIFSYLTHQKESDGTADFRNSVAFTPFNKRLKQGMECL